MAVNTTEVRRIGYQKKGPKFYFGHETDWIYVEEWYSDKRYASLQRMAAFGAIRGIVLK